MLPGVVETSVQTGIFLQEMSCLQFMPCCVPIIQFPVGLAGFRLRTIGVQRGSAPPTRGSYSSRRVLLPTQVSPFRKLFGVFGLLPLNPFIPFLLRVPVQSTGAEQLIVGRKSL